MRELSHRATLVSGLAALGLALLLGACGEVGDAELSDATSGGLVETREPDASDATATTSGQPNGEWTSMERAVLDAFSDDPAVREARYEVGAGRIVVTVYTEGKTISEERLRDLQTRAEEVTGGTPVVVATTDEDVPSEN